MSEPFSLNFEPFVMTIHFLVFVMLLPHLLFQMFSRLTRLTQLCILLVFPLLLPLLCFCERQINRLWAAAAAEPIIPN